MDILVREATLGDLAALTELTRVTFAETFTHYPEEELAAYLAQHYSADRIRHALSVPTRRTWLAEGGGGLLGYAVAGDADLPHPEITERAGQLHRLYLRPPAKGLGIGRRLMDTALDWLASQGRGPVYLGVWEKNLRAQDFYRSYGFRRVGDYQYPVGSTVDLEFILRRD